MMMMMMIPMMMTKMMKMKNNMKDIKEIYELADDYIVNGGDFTVVENSSCGDDIDGFVYSYLCIGADDEDDIKEMLEEFFNENDLNIIVTVIDLNYLTLFDYYEFSVKFEFDDSGDEVENSE